MNPRTVAFRLLLVVCMLVAGQPDAAGPRPRTAAATQATGCPVAGFSPGAGIMWESDGDLRRDLDEMVTLGAQWVRLDFGWTNMEPARGTYDWSNTDRVVDAVTAKGLRVVAILHATPAWARAPGTDNIFYPPTDPATFASFVERTVARYSPKVKVWEMFNEPNISRFWQPAPDPVAYTTLLKAAYAAAKKADAGATVLTAGLSPAVDAADGSQVAPATFLRRIYESGGQGAFDAVGIHPYSFPARPIDPKTDYWNTFQRMPLLYDLMVRNGDANKKVWITEFGATTGTAPDAVNETEHAVIVAESFRAMAQLPFVGGPIFIYAIRDAGTDPAEREDNFGLLRRDFSAKASRAAYARATATCLQAQPATLSIGDVTVLEGNSGPSTANFTITRAGDSSGTSSVQYATVAGTATAGSDFVAVGPTTVSFGPGETSKTAPVTINGGVGGEPDETFTVKLSSPIGASIADDTALATIVNDDALPTLAVNDVAVTEGNVGATAATFTITRSGVTTYSSSVQYATVAGTAGPGTDFVAAGPTTLQFAGGETVKTVTVSVNGDTSVEANETFSLKLSSPAEAVLSDDTGVATIVNDDAAPTTLSVDDVSVGEGLLGATATFTITRAGVTSGSSSVQYATADGTATAGSDYRGVGPATVTFAPGETTKTVPVAVLPDLANEANETVLLNLSSPAGAAISDDQGVATIVDDDLLLGLLETPGPATFVTVNDVAVVEGSSGTTGATFTLVRSGVTSGPSSVQYGTVEGTATAAADFVAAAPTVLNFAAGETVKTVTVAVKADTLVEPAETFSLKLSAPSGVTISDDTGVGTILDDDLLPTVAIGDATVVEGDAGTTTATFTLTRSGVASAPASVQYATAAGTAAAGSDFRPVAPTTVSFAAGETVRTVTVAVLGDTVDEPEERFSVKLSSPTALTIADDTGTGTIIDDDALPTVAVGNVALPVADIDTWAIFSVTRSGNTEAPSSVKYATAPGTAAEGSDYVGLAPTTLTFAERETFKIVTVQVKANTVATRETFSLNLSSPTGAAIADGEGAAALLPAPPSTTTESTGARYNPVTPARILDTRFGNGAPTATIGPGMSLDLQVTGRGGVPADGVSAVVLNVTVTEPTEAGYVTAYPTGEARPLASNLNFSKGQTVPNLVVVKLGAAGKVTLFNAGGTVNLIADVAGWYGMGTATSGSRYNPVTPARVLDTRFGMGAPPAPVGPNGTLDLQVTGQAGVPASGVAAVVLNVTATGPTATSFLTAFPTGEAQPLASNLNFNATQTVPNLVMVKVGAGGKVSLYNSAGTVDMIADVAGWYDTGSAASGSRYNPVTPSRTLDTRDGTGVDAAAPLGASAALDLQVTGRGGVPASGVSAVILNVTITSPSSLSFLTAFPTGEAQPLASNLNFTAGRTVPNLVVVKVGTGGKVRLYNNAGNVEVIADVAGWYGTS